MPINSKDKGARAIPNKEIWKDVVGYEGLYMVSNMGRVLSLPKYHYTEPRLLKPTLHYVNKRYSVILTKSPGNHKRVSVHRLVAMAFVQNPDPEKFTEINHRDENPLNNCADNLEWCDRWYNMHYNNLHRRLGRTDKRKPVIAFREPQKDIIEYESLESAKADGYDPSGIRLSINTPLKNGAKRRYKGYYWEFKNAD